MYFFKEKILGTLLDSQIIRMDTAFAFSLYYSNFEYVQLQFYLLFIWRGARDLERRESSDKRLCVSQTRFLLEQV